MSGGVQVGRCLVLLLLPMVPASHLLVGVGTTVAERLLYTPSVGFCMLLGAAASAALRAPRAPRGRGRRSDALQGQGRRRLRRRLRRAALALLLAALTAAAAARAARRNADWASSEAITLASAAACPGSAKAQLSLGTSRLAAADEAGARRAFRRALAIHADYPDALYWLGRLALQRGQLLQAAKKGMHGTCMHVHMPHATCACACACACAHGA